MEDLRSPLIAQAVLKVNTKRTLFSSYRATVLYLCGIYLRNLRSRKSSGRVSQHRSRTRSRLITQVIFRYFSRALTRRRRNLLTAREMAVRLNYILSTSAQRQIVIYWSNERRHRRTLEQQASRSLIVSRTISYEFP